MDTIYLDHAATTPMHPAVLEEMYQFSKTTFGNPSSIHSFGRDARQKLDAARRTIATQLQVDPKEIIFTSGGTEANNLALIGTALANEHKGKHIITSAQEHAAVLDTVKYLQKLGFHITFIPVTKDGLVEIEEIQKAITDETILVSIMAVNNETGMIQPIDQIGQLLKKKDIYFHTDFVQAFFSLDINIKRMGVDLLTISSHKINGPKGVGCLYMNTDVPFQPLLFGGSQERKQRPGTENIVGIVGFAKAVEMATLEKEERQRTYERYKALFIETLKKKDVHFLINGHLDQMVPTIVNISFPSLDVESLLTNFDLQGIAASSGSACTAGSVEPSHVLTAMFGKSDDRINSSIRFSFGMHNNEEQMVEAAQRIGEVVHRLYKFKGGV